MSSRTLNEYRIFCQTENKFVTAWSSIKPTLCPNSNSDTIDNNSVTIIDSISSNDVNIIQSDPGLTSGTYRIEGFSITIPANSTLSKDMSWPFNIAVMTINLYNSTEHIGDKVWGLAAPNTTIGVLTQSVSQGDTVIHVSPSVFKFIKIGQLITITNGHQKLDMEQCVHIDSVNNTLTCEIPANAPIAQNAYIQFTAQTIKNVVFGNSQTISMANKHLGSTPIPKGIISRLFYTNTGNFDKTFTYSVEYLL